MHSRRRSFPSHVIAIAILAGAALLPAGCSSVEDHLTGVAIPAAAPTTCIQRCRDLYRTLFDAEQKRHLANHEVCQLLDAAARTSCIETESARHSAEMERLSQGLTDCQRSCARGPAG